MNMLMMKITSMVEDIDALKAKSASKPSFSSFLRNNLEAP
jgi:hypothetical protein